MQFKPMLFKGWQTRDFNVKLKWYWHLSCFMLQSIILACNVSKTGQLNTESFSVTNNILRWDSGIFMQLCIWKARHKLPYKICSSWFHGLQEHWDVNLKVTVYNCQSPRSVTHRLWLQTSVEAILINGQ